MTEESMGAAAVEATFPGTLYDGDGTVLTAGDRLWRLPDSLGVPPELPAAVLAELAAVVRRGGGVGLIGRDPGVFTLVRDALVLLLDDRGGRA